MRAASHSARLSSAPHSTASRRTAQAIRTSAATAISRIPRTAGTRVPPVTHTTPFARTRNTGPYGAGVSVQWPPTLAAASAPRESAARTDGPCV